MSDPKNGNPIVFVIQDDGYKNFQQAESFGQLEVMFTRDLSLYSDPSPRIHHASKLVSRYDPERDFFLLTGDPVLIGLVCGLSLKKYNKFRALKWDKTTQRYNSLSVSL